MDNYYDNQAGTGIATYAGLRFQKGHGFLGRFFKGILFPLIKKALPHVAGAAISSAGEIAGEIKQGKNFKSAARNSLKRHAVELAEQGLNTLKGSGKRRKKRRKQQEHLF